MTPRVREILDNYGSDNPGTLTNLARLLAEAETAIRAGQTRPASEFFEEFRREKKIPRRA